MTLVELLPSPRHGSNPHVDPAIWPLSAYVDEAGRLCVGGVATTDVAAAFGTPTHVVDEDDFRARIRDYRAALPDGELIYAGKALLSVAVAGWAAAEGAGVGIYSGEQLAIALAADVSPSRMILHGNAKTAAELDDAVAAGVGRIAIETPGEIALLAGRVRRRQRVLLRVVPDLDTAAVGTGALDQKFGFAAEQDRAATAVKRILGQPWLDLVGLHCRLGSQLSDAELYGTAIRRMIAAMAEIRYHHQVVLTELNLGGGHAVPYVSFDPELSPRTLATVVDAAVKSACTEYGFPRPTVVIEAGRAIAARAGITLYRVITVKRRPAGRTLVAVDGDLHGSANHTVALANRHIPSATAPVTVVSRHCDAADGIAVEVELPADIHPGDLLAVAGTGAYHRPMGSSHNLIGAPPLIGVADGKSRELVRRETAADILARDCSWHGSRRAG